MTSRVNIANVPLEGMDLNRDRSIAMQDNSRCPLGFLLRNGNCHFSGYKCYYVDNGREGIGLINCPVIPVIYKLVDGDIRIN